MKGWACIALCIAVAGVTHVAWAQTTIYRCTDAKGEMTVQNAPCPEGSKQDKREVKDVATQPLPGALKSGPTPPPVRATSASEALPATRASSEAKVPAPLHLSARPEPAAAPPAPTGPATTIYRCTDASGALTIQNGPCPAGSRTDKREVQGVASMPLPGTAPKTTTPQTVAPASSSASGEAGADGDRSRSGALALPPVDDAQTLQTVGGMTLIEDPTLHKDDASADASASGGNAKANSAADVPAGRVTGIAPPLLFQCTTYDNGTYLTEEAKPQSRCAPLKTVGLDGNPYGGAGKACEVIYDVCARVTDERLCSAWSKRLGETEVAFRYAAPEKLEQNKADYERVLRIVQDSGCTR